MRTLYRENTVKPAMYKTRNTGTAKGMRGTWGMGGILYSGEYRQILRGISSNIPGNVTKHSGKCPQTFPECLQTFRGIPSNIHCCLQMML